MPGSALQPRARRPQSSLKPKPQAIEFRPKLGLESPQRPMGQRRRRSRSPETMLTQKAQLAMAEVQARPTKALSLRQAGPEPD